jgi:hypothetical protein
MDDGWCYRGDGGGGAVVEAGKIAHSANRSVIQFIILQTSHSHIFVHTFQVTCGVLTVDGTVFSSRGKAIAVFSQTVNWIPWKELV